MHAYFFIYESEQHKYVRSTRNPELKTLWHRKTEIEGRLRAWECNPFLYNQGNDYYGASMLSGLSQL